MNTDFSKINYEQYKEPTISGRYLTLKSVEQVIEKLNSRFKVVVEGYSEEKRPIYSITFSSGKFNVLMWSQMHGNESTTTKAIFDFLNFLSSNKKTVEDFTFKIIPMLNPDGSLRYTRENANRVDLNRDAQNKSQSEIKTLFEVFKNFKPDLCLNMHDQRSIFSAGQTSNPAAISFLAPSADTKKSLPQNRVYAMRLIAFVNNCLQKQLPGKVGRYSDEFNPDCLGDTFQSMKVPAILIEAGHFDHDYYRENTREFIFKSFLYLIHGIKLNKNDLPDIDEYFKIPENEKMFVDILVKNAKTLDGVSDIAVQFEERLINQEVQFIPKVLKSGVLDFYFGHKTIQANSKEVFINNNNKFSIGDEIKMLIVNGENISMK